MLSVPKYSVFLCLAIWCVNGASATAQEDAQDKDLVADLKLLQGRWELKVGDTRSVKTIEGNKETVRRYDAKTGELRREHSVTFKLSKSGDVRVFTFFGRPGGRGRSFVYKVDKDNFWDVPGLLQGAELRNYRETPALWHWKRLPEKEESSD